MNINLYTIKGSEDQKNVGKMQMEWHHCGISWRVSGPGTSCNNNLNSSFHYGASPGRLQVSSWFSEKSKGIVCEALYYVSIALMSKFVGDGGGSGDDDR